MSAEAPRAVGGEENTLTMTQGRHEPTVISVAVTGPFDELTRLAVNDGGDQRDEQRLPVLHRAPHQRARLPEPVLDHTLLTTTDAALAIDVVNGETVAAAAARLDIDVAEMPRLMAALRGSLVARSASLDILIAEADKLGLAPDVALAALIATSMPERFASVAELAHHPPHGQAQATLTMYVTALLADELARSMPPQEAVRMAAIASGRLTRLAPEDIFLVAFAIPSLIDGMGRAGRVEASTAIAALVHAAPDTLARVTAENREIRLLIEARAMAERWHEPTDPDSRGLAIAAAFILLANARSSETARALFERANLAVGSAASRIVLSCADEQEREEELEDRVSRTLDRLEPFLAGYDRLRAELVHVNTVPRAELCNTLHAQLTRGSERFYLALLSLLRRHQTFATRSGTRALRTALEDRDTWDRLAVA